MFYRFKAVCGEDWIINTAEIAAVVEDSDANEKRQGPTSAYSYIVFMRDGKRVNVTHPDRPEVLVRILNGKT